MTKTKELQNNIHAILAEKAAESTDLHLLVQNIISETINYMEAASGSIMVYDSEEDCLKLYVSGSHPTLAKSINKSAVKKIPLNDSISAKVFKSGKAIISNKTDKTESSIKLSRKNDSGSFLSVPLTINKKTIGVMNFNRTSNQIEFEKTDLDKLSGINTLIASLIDKETLLERIEDNRKEISALFKMSSLLSGSNDFTGRLEEFLRLLSKELGMKRSAIIKTDISSKNNKNAGISRDIEIIAAHQLKKTQLNEMFDSITERIKQRLIANIPSNNEEEIPLTLLFDDGNDTCEMYCIPLYVEDTNPYFLIVSRNLTETDKSQAKKYYRFLQIISQNISNALTREKMLRTIRHDQQIQKENAERNKVFFEISKDLGSTLDPYIILQKAFDQFNKIISFTTISILLFDDLDSSYKLIIQPAEPISLKYQNNLTQSIFDLFNEYPATPTLSENNLSQPTYFNPHDAEAKPVSTFKNVLHLPIILGSSVKGLIHLARKGSESFSAEELNITSQFTGIFITSIKNALIHKRTEKLAFTDPLTELYNHRFFQETLQQEFTRATRYKKPLSLMILDIDFFKKFNDTYGHLVGDKVLKHVSSIFKASIREQIDTVARYGGEEFAVILPETSLEGASVFAERIRSKVEESVVEDGDKTLKVTISIGVACASVTKCEKTSDLIEAADQALYQAKLNGRNQFQTFKDSTVSYEKKH